MHALIEKVSGQVERDYQFTYFFKQHMEILYCTREEAFGVFACTVGLKNRAKGAMFKGRSGVSAVSCLNRRGESEECGSR